MLSSRSRLFRFAALGLLAPASALAAGYDTPMLYSARHMGMGGTAIGAVDDPSAIFHNPAGLARIQGGMAMGDFSPLMGGIHASPSDHVLTTNGVNSRPGMNIDSDRTFAPFFLAGAAYRLHRMITLGVAAYPVASAGAAYHYNTQKNGTSPAVEMEDRTKLVFLEFAPSLAVEPLPGLRLGASYRYSTVEFERQRINPTDDFASPATVDLMMKGSNPKGWKLGAQYTAGDFDLGLVYRHRTDTTVQSDTGVLNGIKAKDVTYGFTLPSKLGAGLQWRGLEQKLRLALDVEYTWQSQNDTSNLAGTTEFGPQKIANINKWQDNMTIRAGGGYSLGAVELRAGFLHDMQASNVKYPSAFGTPPGATNVATIGAGWQISDALDVSIAGAWRHGTATVTEADVKDNGCLLCGKSGDYAIDLFGAYVDVRWRFGASAKPAPAGVEPAPAAPVESPAAPTDARPPTGA